MVRNIFRTFVLHSITALLISAQLGGLALLADAKTLYVDASTGSDATTYAANDAAHPWQSIGRAAWGSTSYASPNSAQAAQAGDIVQVAAGTYNENGGTALDRFAVALNPANSGTSGSPITFRGIGNVYIRLNNGIRGPMIGCASSRNYVIWDHFQIDDYYGGSLEDTGPVVMVGSTGCQVINSDIQGHSGSYFWGYTKFSNNYNAVRIEFCTGCRVYNNSIHRVWGTGTSLAGSNQNDAGVMVYDSDDPVIEHNEIYDTGQGVILKGYHAPTTLARARIRFNYVRDNNFGGIRVLGASDAYVYQNIVTNTLWYGLWVGFQDTNNPRIFNNTLYGNACGILAQSAAMVDNQFDNNLIVNSTGQAACSSNVAAPNLQDLIFRRNFYYNNTNLAQWNTDGTPLTISFATWQGTYGFDTAGVNGTNPQFTNPAAGNFHIANATALAAGRVTIEQQALGVGTSGSIIPVGAYITGNETIGIESTSPKVSVSGSASFSGRVTIQ